MINQLTDFALEAEPEVPVRRWMVREVALRTVSECPATDALQSASSPQQAAQFYRQYIAVSGNYNADVEHFAVLMLNRKNQVIGWTMVSTGTATASLAHPREVFRAAILASASAVVLCHNHPSGDPAPSAADLQVTRQLKAAGQVVDISVMDHVIVGRQSEDPTGRGYFSFREAGLL